MAHTNDGCLCLLVGHPCQLLRFAALRLSVERVERLCNGSDGPFSDLLFSVSFRLGLLFARYLTDHIFR